jgi:adenylate cyclase
LTVSVRLIFEKLRKRKVFKVAGAYAIVAWVVVQVADVMFPALGLPAWTITLTAALLMVGFPLALVLAWAFEVTPQGIRRDTGDGTPGAPADSIGDAADATGPTTGSSATADTQPAVLGKPERDQNSIAVLPFLDLSAGRDNEYFADGLTEELLNVLCSIDGLRVSSRTSCFSFKGKDVDIPAVSGKLKVAYVLEGSVRKDGNRIRITAQLIEASSDSHIWSDTYDRELEDVFAIQRDIAQKIVGALRLRMNPQELPAATTLSAKAYDCYLRGRSFVHKFGPQSLRFAIDMFLRATQIDPQFARAWAGLADAHAIMAIYYTRDPAHRLQADEASARALALAPELAEAHVSRGLAFLATEAYDRAEAEFVKAIELAPQMFEGYYHAGRSCIHQGQLNRGLQFFEQASAVSPEDYNVPLIAAPMYRSLGDENRARELERRGVELAERHLEIYPDCARPYYLGSTALLHMGQMDKALDWVKRAIAIDPVDQATLYNVACFYAQAGRTDEALDCLEKADLSRTWLQNDTEIDPIREHPRFEALLRRSSAAREDGDS